MQLCCCCCYCFCCCCRCSCCCSYFAKYTFYIFVLVIRVNGKQVLPTFFFSLYYFFLFFRYGFPLYTISVQLELALYHVSIIGRYGAIINPQQNTEVSGLMRSQKSYLSKNPWLRKRYTSAQHVHPGEHRIPSYFYGKAAIRCMRIEQLKLACAYNCTIYLHMFRSKVPLSLILTLCGQIVVIFNSEDANRKKRE